MDRKAGGNFYGSKSGQDTNKLQEQGVGVRTRSERWDGGVSKGARTVGKRSPGKPGRKRTVIGAIRPVSTY